MTTMTTCLWNTLSDDLILKIVRHLEDDNEVSCTHRLLNMLTTSFSLPLSKQTFLRLLCEVKHHMRRLSLKQRRELLRRTIQCGNLDHLIALIPAASCIMNDCFQISVDGLMEAAATAGHLEICVYLATICNNGSIYMRNTCDTMHPEKRATIRTSGVFNYVAALIGAAGAGHGPVVLWVIDQMRRLPKAGPICHAFRLACMAAARGGHEDLCGDLLRRRSLESGCDSSDDTLLGFMAAEAAAGGHGKLMTSFLYEKIDHGSRPTFEKVDVMKEILWNAAHGLLLMEFKELFNEIVRKQDRLELFMRECRLRVMLKTLFSTTADWRDKFSWLTREIGCSFEPDDEPDIDYDNWLRCDDAVERFEILRHKGLPIIMSVFLRNNLHLIQHVKPSVATYKGDFIYALLKTLRSPDAADLMQELIALAGFRHELDMGRRAFMASAAKKGRLDVFVALGDAKVKMAIADKDTELMRNASSSGNLELVTYLRERGCRFCAWTFSEAVRSGNIALVEQLVDWGIGPPAQFDAMGPMNFFIPVIRNQDLEMLRYLRGLDCCRKYKKSAIRKALLQGYVKIDLPRELHEWLCVETDKPEKIRSAMRRCRIVLLLLKSRMTARMMHGLMPGSRTGVIWTTGLTQF